MTGAFAVAKYHEGPGVVRLLVSGDLDQDVSEALTTIIVNAMDHEPVLALLVDLGQATFLAAAGVRSLLEGQAEAARRGTEVRLENAHGPVAMVLETLNVPFVTSTGSPTRPCRPARADSPSGTPARRRGADLDR